MTLYIPILLLELTQRYLCTGNNQCIFCLTGWCWQGSGSSKGGIWKWWMGKDECKGKRATPVQVCTRQLAFLWAFHCLFRSKRANKWVDMSKEATFSGCYSWKNATYFTRHCRNLSKKEWKQSQKFCLSYKVCDQAMEKGLQDSYTVSSHHKRKWASQNWTLNTPGHLSFSQMCTYSKHA